MLNKQTNKCKTLYQYQTLPYFFPGEREENKQYVTDVSLVLNAQVKTLRCHGNDNDRKDIKSQNNGSCTGSQEILTPTSRSRSSQL